MRLRLAPDPAVDNADRLPGPPFRPRAGLGGRIKPVRLIRYLCASLYRFRLHCNTVIRGVIS